MDPCDLDELEFFRALAGNGVRLLVIGRKALIMLGLPVATHDYGLWIDPDDIERLNAAVTPLHHFPNLQPAEARARGRYVLENGEHIDVLLTRRRDTQKGETLTFEDAWNRRQRVELSSDVNVFIPCIDDLIRTKEWSMRAKDIGDIQLLEALRKAQRQA